MSNIKITAEVNGKQVPLEIISTTTFEAIKALEKPKEIPVPVARLATCDGLPRLIFKVTENIAQRKGQYIAVDLVTGNVAGHWPGDDDDCGKDYGYHYSDVRPL